MKWKCLDLRMVHARADLNSSGDVWTYCHLSICQQLWSVGKEHTRGVPLNGNAEVLLGLPLVSGAKGRWRSHLGNVSRRSPIGSSSDWQIFCPLAAEDFLQSENDGFAAALFHQSGYRDLRAFHRLAKFHEVIKCRADL